MREHVICVAEAIVQLIVLVAVYPVWFLVGLYARKTRLDRFRHGGLVGRLMLFPAFGRWYLPMLWLTWHY